MTIKLRLTLGLLLLAPALAQALGLGDMRQGSGLNQAFSADIEIVGASPDDLVQLRAGLPTREMFTRYGVDRPGFLSALNFKVSKDAAGRAVIHVSSAETMTEPFLTFLVEVSWPRGHLIREYTALLDPPVFDQKPSAPAPIAAPATGESTSAATGAVVRTAPAPTPAPVSAPSTSPAPSAAASSSINSSEYRVALHDTLSGIARRAGAAAKGDINRLMIATFRANPAAFDGNINRLHKGALLKIPGSEEWASISANEAAHEVGRQINEWKGAAPAEHASAEEQRLRLVPPAETPGSKGTPGAAPGPSAADTARIAQQEKADRAAADAKRLIELKNDALAQAQGKNPAPVAPVPATTAPTPQPPVTAPTPATTPPVATAPAATETPAPVVQAKPTPAPATPVAAPGLLDSLNWIWVLVGAALIAILGLFAFSARRRRRADVEFDHALQSSDRDPMAATPRFSRSEAPRESMVVEESDDDSGEFQAPAISRIGTRTEPAIPAPLIDDTLSTTALNLEQADPLAEADFHMAYGLYDQAADIVKLAIGREPNRRDLKLKLLEVYFVWGNKDSFLEVARELGRTRDSGAAGEWDKVVIMGRQIAGDDPLFQGAGTGAPATDVDLDLEAGGSQGVDLELLGGDSPQTKTVTNDDFVDLDLGQALAGADSMADTGESKTLDPDRLDLLLEGEHTDQSGATTRQMTATGRDAPTVEQPALRSVDAPTVETPVLASERENTIREKLDSALRRERSAAADATAELSLDDLGFEIEKLGSTSTSLEALSVTDHPSDAPTMIAGLDEGTRALLAAADKGLKSSDLEPTRETPHAFGDLEPTRESPRPAPDATQRIPQSAAPAKLSTSSDTGTARVLGAGDLDLDLDELARALEHDTVEQPRREEVKFSTDVFQTAIRKGPNGLDLDVGAPLGDHREPTVTQRVDAEDLALPELEPVTLSEVGTKLDLARAYMDMGDPDGARSILQEVLTEGSASQKQEAQRLIETLPG